MIYFFRPLRSETYGKIQQPSTMPIKIAEPKELMNIGEAQTRSY